MSIPDGPEGVKEGVKDVAVIGVPHEKYGEVPRAYVVKHDGAQGLTEDSVKAYVAEKLTGMLTITFLKGTRVLKPWKEFDSLRDDSKCEQTWQLPQSTRNLRGVLSSLR